MNNVYARSVYILGILFALPFISFAQNLDLTFDSDGVVTTSVSIGNDYGRSMVIQPDGKIVVAGNSSNGLEYVFTIVRYNTNGSLDSTFDTDGIVTTSIGDSNSRANAVAIQSDGKIVAAGFGYNGTSADFALARYNTNGSLDSTFDNDGIVTTAIGGGISNNVITSMLIQPDGKIVTGGSSTNINNSAYVFTLTRYNTDGSLDNSFDTDGIAITQVWYHDAVNALALQSDGKIIAAGLSLNFNYDLDVALARYNTDGSLDNTFDNDGIVTTVIGASTDIANAVAIQPDGKIVIAGVTYNGFDFDFALVRYNANGSLDNTFDTDGIVTTIIGPYEDYAYAIAIQSDEKIVVAGGAANFNSLTDIALVRYNTNGSLDSAFDSDGIVITPVGTSHSEGYSMAIQPDKKIVVAGYTYNGPPNNTDFCIARYDSVAAACGTDVVISTSPYNILLTESTSFIETNGTVMVDSGAYVKFDADSASYILLMPGFFAKYDCVFIAQPLDGCNAGSPQLPAEKTVASQELSDRAENMFLYPNPTTGKLTIVYPETLTEADIYNMMGKKVRYLNLSAGTRADIDIEDLPNGVYILSARGYTNIKIIKH